MVIAIWVTVLPVHLVVVLPVESLAVIGALPDFLALGELSYHGLGCLGIPEIGLQNLSLGCPRLLLRNLIPFFTF